MYLRASICVRVEETACGVCRVKERGCARLGLVWAFLKRFVMICCSVCTTCICAPVRHTEHTLIKLKGRHPTTTTLGQTHTHIPVHWPAQIQMGLPAQTHKHTYCQCHKKQRIWTNNISTIILGLLERDWIELQYWKKISMLSFRKLLFFLRDFHHWDSNHLYYVLVHILRIQIPLFY